MGVFYKIEDKTPNEEFLDKYDLAKFIDGQSDVPTEVRTRFRIVTQQIIPPILERGV